MLTARPPLPLSSHQRRKKDVLSLEYDEFLHLVTIMLFGYEVSVYDLYQTTKAITHSRSTATTERIVAKLAQAEMTFSTWRTVGLSNDYRLPTVFASDQLQPGHLRTLVSTINTLKSYPSGDSAHSRYGRRYADVSIRAVHKLLQNEARQFRSLYGELTETTHYLHYERSTALASVQDILGTIDWPFWEARKDVFKDLAWLTFQSKYTKWDEETPQRLEPALISLFDTAQRLPETARAALLLGFHYYREQPDLYPGDAGLRLVADLTSGRTPAPGNSTDGASIQAAESEPVGFVEIIQTAYAYGRGDRNADWLKRTVGTFTMSNYPLSINCFLAFVMVETGDAEGGEKLYAAQFTPALKHPLDWLVVLWCAGWMGYKLRTSQLNSLVASLEEGAFDGLPWLHGEILYALRSVAPQTAEQHALKIGALTQVPGSSALRDVLPQKPTWAYTLRQLQYATGEGKVAEEAPQFRTIWILDFDAAEVICKEQKMGKTGWSKGRKVKWSELITPKNAAVLEEADGRAVQAISLNDGRAVRAGGYYSEDMLFVSFGRMLYEIADHPRIYLGDKKRIPLDLQRAEAELQISETATGLQLRFDPPVETAGFVWRKETPTRYKVYHLSEEQAQIAFSVGDGVEIPNTERAAVEAVVESIRPRVQVQSTLDLIDEDLETTVGSTKPCFHLLPFGEGYKVELYVKPVTDQSFYFKPGDGLPRSIVVLEEGRRILERNLAEETAEAAEAILSCPTLARTPQENYEWAIKDTQTALRILLELRKLVLADLASIEHPKGEKLRIVGEAGQNELAIKVGKSRDWFEVDGQLTVNEEKVASLQSLLEHLKAQRDNPFIELADGEFLAITDDLRDKVLEMEGLLHSKAKGLQLPTLAAGAFDAIAEDLADVEFDDEWRSALDRIERAEKIRPRVPKHFNAELRDYQTEGYRWMMRLAEWGVGGCLADDMGLGKTVQALAMLTARADRGPALVIAPASVTRNWLRETEKFAPGLIPILIASSQDTQLLSELGTGDLALISYGLLPFIGEELEEIEWATIVIDEAQAIKNSATKRAKIVQNLRADFKLATTGTPIENHLGELWSLFRFLNPGLLGSKQAFNGKYNRPIAVNGDEDRREALKNLVKPFILRRRKDQVLTELPPKTEITLAVDLSEEEKALYEAMRRQALKEIAEAGEQEKRFKVLAQLTKLRQAACHPRLVRPTSKIGSAKLALVGETLLEILESGHKALIFSQFVKHLKIVENWVKGQGISYQYLDGSTPGKKREEAVNAFQAGEGQVFLISLKAGGTGLNLTEADYVLHLDPWWNPAAEDQASDRAHRIGQQRPVTVYRFVSQGTIEEQIIALHADKRDLADQILSGTGKAGKLGVAEILTLINDPLG
ncbi:DEAD/DEAH box helicase [Neolewinella antarctica]|uniref:Superfamily II DNA or RNA helicase n=1 Tax=Neolewinella antarctica TaxID=442734 RepID=A0ABX0X8I1_9BACT|nr:DEAD/DEAH box helicase [Neolewinella antarctica]NJC25561.1 superfamily II DNA or RNA helicase [Neolewinella antarctica]